MIVRPKYRGFDLIARPKAPGSGMAIRPTYLEYNKKLSGDLKD